MGKDAGGCGRLGQGRSQERGLLDYGSVGVLRREEENRDDI